MMMIWLAPTKFLEAQKSQSDGCHYYIVITLSTHRLSLYCKSEEDNKVDEIKTYLIATPRRGLKGVFGQGRIESIEFNPWWYPTEATRKDFYKERGIQLPKAVPPNHSLNAMGKVKIKISHILNGGKICRIHGTNDPSKIGRSVSRGCFRMNNEDILELVKFLKVGTLVIIK